VFVFARLFSSHDYGVYLLGVGFASVVSVVLVSWFRNLILSGHARDGPDVRGVVISGYLILCLTAPLAYGAARPVGLGVWIPGLEARTRLPTIERPIGYRDFE
jgi:O-antigen/teichoic acid export membrane protein